MAEIVEAKEKKVNSGMEVSSNSKMLAAVAWLLSPLSSLVLILLDNYKQDKYVQFHAWQSLVYSVAFYVLGTVLSWTCIVPLVLFVVYVIGVVKAFQGEMWKVPMIGDWAEEQAEKASGTESSKK